jgi:hypothetical protein
LRVAAVAKAEIQSPAASFQLVVLHPTCVSRILYLSLAVPVEKMALKKHELQARASK